MLQACRCPRGQESRIGICERLPGKKGTAYILQTSCRTNAQRRCMNCRYTRITQFSCADRRRANGHSWRRRWFDGDGCGVARAGTRLRLEKEQERAQRRRPCFRSRAILQTSSRWIQLEIARPKAVCLVTSVRRRVSLAPLRVPPRVHHRPLVAALHRLRQRALPLHHLGAEPPRLQLAAASALRRRPREEHAAVLPEHGVLRQGADLGLAPRELVVAQRLCTALLRRVVSTTRRTTARYAYSTDASCGQRALKSTQVAVQTASRPPSRPPPPSAAQPIHRRRHVAARVVVGRLARQRQRCERHLLS